MLFIPLFKKKGQSYKFQFIKKKKKNIEGNKFTYEVVKGHQQKS